MNVLMFDLENGSQTLGSNKHIEDLFSFPVLSPSTWDQFQGIIGQLYTSVKKQTDKKVGGITITEEKTHIVPKNGTVIDSIIIDTFSELSKKYQRSLTDKTGKMKLHDWGKLKNKLDVALEFISRIPGVVVLNCHSKSSTMDDGTSKIQPYIDGSTREDISKWFDFVFYTKTIVDPAGNRKYVWITKRSETYDHAKDRTDLLSTEMDQDFQKVLNASKEKGFDSCRILVIGSPGSGKTWSLRTLVKKEKKNAN